MQEIALQLDPALVEEHGLDVLEEMAADELQQREQARRREAAALERLQEKERREEAAVAAAAAAEADAQVVQQLRTV